MAGQSRRNSSQQDLHHDEMITKTVQSLWVHIACYVPLIFLCVWAYFEPADPEVVDPHIVACNRDYKEYLLVSGLCMIPAMLFILYIVSCKRLHSIESIEMFAGLALGLECLIFSALYVYKMLL